MPQSLPDADELFSRFFDRWYDDDDRLRKGFTHTRPDMTLCYRPGLNASEICNLTSKSQADVHRRIQRMLDSAQADWPSYLPVTGEVNEHWIEAFDDFYDAEQVASAINRSAPSDFSNDLVVVVCQFGAVLGHMLHQTQPRLQWIPEWPYWESSLYDPASGNVIAPFHWAMKKFSSYGVDDGYVPKLHMCIHILDQPK